MTNRDLFQEQYESIGKMQTHGALFPLGGSRELTKEEALAELDRLEEEGGFSSEIMTIIEDAESHSPQQCRFMTPICLALWESRYDLVGKWLEMADRNLQCASIIEGWPDKKGGKVTGVAAIGKPEVYTFMEEFLVISASKDRNLPVGLSKKIWMKYIRVIEKQTKPFPLGGLDTWNISPGRVGSQQLTDVVCGMRKKMPDVLDHLKPLVAFKELFLMYPYDPQAQYLGEAKNIFSFETAEETYLWEMYDIQSRQGKEPLSIFNMALAWRQLSGSPLTVPIKKKRVFNGCGQILMKQDKDADSLQGSSFFASIPEFLMAVRLSEPVTWSQDQYNNILDSMRDDASSLLRVFRNNFFTLQGVRMMIGEAKKNKEYRMFLPILIYIQHIMGKSLKAPLH